jgi:hypothetical protein
MKTSVNDGCTNIQHSRTEQPVFKAGYVPCNSRFAGPKSIHLHEPAPEIKKAMAGPGGRISSVLLDQPAFCVIFRQRHQSDIFQRLE